MIHRMPLAVLAALALTLAAVPAHAFRCGSRIVKEGDPQARVLRHCGEPVSAQQRVIWRSGVPVGYRRSIIVEGAGGRIESSRGEVLLHERAAVEILVDEWTYNLGPHKLMRLVRFENGLVTEVLTLGYGYRE